MGSCVSQFCQQQDQMVLSAGLGIEHSTKSPQQIYNQGNSRSNQQKGEDNNNNNNSDDDDDDGENADEEMQLTQMIMELNCQGASQNIQNLMNQRYNMELQSISLIEQAQCSYIAKVTNLEADQEFSNNYFLSEQLISSKHNQEDPSYNFQKRNSNSNFVSHMIQSFASGGLTNENSPSQQQRQQKQASALNKKQKKRKRQFLIFRLPRTQFLLPRLAVVPSLNAQEIQDSYFLKDLYELQKLVSSNLIINNNSKRRVSTSQFYQQNIQEKLTTNNNNNNFHQHSLFFQKLKIVMNEILMNDLSFLSTLESWSTIQKLSIHIQNSTNTDFLGMLILRFKDVQALNIRFDVSFVPTSDFLTAACQLSNMTKLKLVFNCLFFESNESSRNFYEMILCPLIGKAFPDRYHQIQSASAQSIPATSFGFINQQQQQPQLIQLTSLKLSFIHSDCSYVIDSLLNKVLKGITMPMLNKLSMKTITVQDAASYQVQMISFFFQTCNQLGNQCAFNIMKIKNLNFGITIQSSDHANLDNHTARFNLSVSNQFEDDIFATKTSSNVNQINSISEISPSLTFRLGQQKKNLIDDSTTHTFMNNNNQNNNINNINQSSSAYIPLSHRNSNNFGVESHTSLSNFNPQISFNLNNNSNHISNINNSIGSNLMLGSAFDTKSLSKNFITGFLKMIDLRKSRKIIIRDETGLNSFNSSISQLRASQNIVQLNLQFCLNSENQFQSLIALLQTNSTTVKKLQLEIEKKILISLYDDHKLFAIISKMQNLLSFTINYKTKEPVFHQIISASNLIYFCEYKNVFNQSPIKTAMRQYTRQVTQNSSLFIKNIGQAKYLLHINSPDFQLKLPLIKNPNLTGENKLHDILLQRLLKQAKKKLALCYISIHPSLKQFYTPNSQLNTVIECSITLSPPLISQNQFLLDISEFY